jgi:hypothetical protein
MRHDAARAEAELLRELSPPPPPEELAPDARIQYLAATKVAPNWIPYLPARKPQAIRAIELVRGTMPAIAGGQPVGTFGPRTELVGRLDDLEESEVTQGGTLVTASFQRARGADGSTHLWKGFMRRAGRDARRSAPAPRSPNGSGATRATDRGAPDMGVAPDADSSDSGDSGVVPSRLTALSPSRGKLEPEFSPEIFEYRARVASWVSSIQITASSPAPITVRGVSVASGVPSDPIMLPRSRQLSGPRFSCVGPLLF